MRKAIIVKIHLLADQYNRYRQPRRGPRGDPPQSGEKEYAWENIVELFIHAV